jgi:hypothetical protein
MTGGNSMTQYFDVDKEMSWCMCTTADKKKRVHKVIDRESREHKGRAVNQLSATGEFIRTHISLAAAAYFVKRSTSSVRDAIIGTSGRRFCAGYAWEYADSPKNDYNYLTEKRKKKWKTARRIIKMDLYGNVLAEFDTLGEAAKDVKSWNCSITKTALGIQKTHKGYKYAYAS